MAGEISYSDLPRYLAHTDAEAERQVIAFARTLFAKPYYFARGDVIRGLGVLGMRPHLRAEIIELLTSGLMTALMRGTDDGATEPGIDANSIGVAAAAVALGRLRASASEDALRTAFARASDNARHYELRQCAGPLGVALCVIGASVSDQVEAVLARDHDIWDAREEFVNQLRYAAWVLRRDTTGPLEWLVGQQKGAHYAAAALADLNAVHAKPELEALLPALKTKGARRALVYALRRLGGGPQEDPMIFSCPLWHINEPADEFPKLYASVLDMKELDAATDGAPVR